MRTALVFSLICVGLIASAEAKLRTRYCYPRNHDTEASANGAPQVYSLAWLGKIEPGIWEGFDTQTGFDEVGAKGTLTDAPYVSAEYWVDSAFEAEKYELRKDAPLVDGWATKDHLLDTSFTLNPDGYCVLAAGGLNIETAGTYEFVIGSDDKALVWIDRNRDGAIDISSGDAASAEECLNGWLRSDGDAGGDPWAWGASNDTTVTLEFTETGLYKILLWYWDASEVGYFELSWKKPGSPSAEPISGSDGALGEPFGGLPVARIAEISVDGTEQDTSTWGNLQVQACAPVSFTAEASNMRGADPVWVWDFFGDATVVCTTTSATATYRYGYDPSIFLIKPSVKVIREETISEASAITQAEIIFIFLQGTDTDCDNSQLPCGETASAIRAGPVSPHEQQQAFVHRNTLVTPPGLYRAVIHDARGRVAKHFTVRGGRTALPALPPGFHALSLRTDGKTVLRVPLMSERRE